MLKKIGIILSTVLAFSCSKKDVFDSDSNLPEIKTNQGVLDFVQTFGGSKNDAAKSVVKTQDGGYAIAGYSQSNNADITDKTDDSFDFWVMKFTENSTLSWSKTFGGSVNDRANDIIQTSDGGFAVLGFSESKDIDVSNNEGFQDFWIAKLAQNGALTWQKSFGFSGLDYGTSLVQTTDNGYLLTGVLDVSASGGLGNAKTSQKHAGGDIWVIKISADGILEWSRYFGGTFTDTAYGVEKTPDGGFIIVGSSDSDDVDIANNKGAYDFWVLKIAATGTLLWEKSFGGSEIDEARGIVATNDGNFLIVGDTRSANQDITFNNGAADVWLLKITSEGEIIWQKTIGATSFDVARSISKTNDNAYIISGSSRSSDNGFTNQGQNDALIIKVDNNGNIVWQKTIGGSEIDILYDAVEINNTAIIAVGETNSADKDVPENKGFSDALLIKIK